MPAPAHETDRGATADRSALFPESDWVFDRVSQSGFPRSGLRPCSCGCAIFVLVSRTVDGTAQHHAYCRKCRDDRRLRMKREGDVVYGRLDVESGIIVYTGSRLAGGH
jgi:hypothetical protein